MSWFRRRRSGGGATAQAQAPEVACPHTSLVPHWDSMDDIGHEERASEYRCDSCQQAFTREDATVLRATEAERLRSLLS